MAHRAFFSFPAIGSDWLQYASLEEAGWSSEKVKEAIEYSAKLESAAIMRIDRGKVVVANGDLETTFKDHSLRKAFLSALIGIYVDRGVIELEKTLEELKIDDVKPLTSLKNRHVHEIH